MAADGCQALWRAVVFRAIEDAAGRSEGAAGYAKIARRSAIDWLGVSDFRRVCSHADLDPSIVRQAVLDAYASRPVYLRRDHKWSDARRAAYQRRKMLPRETFST